jgi:small multidrug resistance pump
MAAMKLNASPGGASADVARVATNGTAAVRTAAQAATSVLEGNGLSSGVITDLFIRPRETAPSRPQAAPAVVAPRWMAPVLVAAGIYNLVWGAVAILAPAWCFRIVGMEVPNYPELWQCIGMIVGVYGIGYLAAATDPLRHWPIVLVGLLGKILGPIGFAGALFSGRFPWAFGWNIVTNDLVWWIPFAVILLTAWRAAREISAPGRTSGIGG